MENWKEKRVGDKDKVTVSETKLANTVIVKMENDASCDVEEIAPKTKTNKLVWIPKIMQFSGESPRSARMEKSKGSSPPAGDEAEENPARSSNDKNVEEKKKKEESASMGVARRSVENSREESVTNGKKESRPIRKKFKINERYQHEEENCSDESDEEGDVKKRFGKITDLITEQQKTEIEKFFVCNMEIVDEKLVNEKLIVYDRKKFGCTICDATYARFDKCQVHIWSHLDMKPYRCVTCGFATVTISNIRSHIRKSHLKIKPYACEFCEKRYATAFLLEEHINTHTGLKPYSCNVCNFTSASRQVLNYHKASHKPVKDVTCDVCGKEFYSKGRLRAHLMIHKEDKESCMCKFCSIYLCNSEALQRHHANVHNKDYECDVCGKRCKSKKALNNHSNVHSAAKYKCNLCSNVYKSSHILKEHLLKHEGIRKYKCTICGKDFAQQSHLAAHMAVHSDKRFFCPGCNRAFNRHDNMKMHTKRCEAFLANPELAKLLLIRRRQSKSLPDNVEKTTQETETRKTDLNVDKERVVEMRKMSRTEDDSRKQFSTVIVENTIPCT